MIQNKLTMKKKPIAFFVIFLLFYVLWLLKGDEFLGVGPDSARQSKEIQAANDKPELETSIRFAWLLGYR